MKKAKIILAAAMAVLCLSVLCSCSAEARVNGSYFGSILGLAPFLD